MSSHRHHDEEALLEDPHAHWREIFRKYVYYEDSRICIDELQDIIRSPEYRVGDIPDATVRQIMAFSGKDKRGYLDEEKFVEMILHPAWRFILESMLWKYARLVVPPTRTRRDLFPDDTFPMTLREEQEMIAQWKIKMRAGGYLRFYDAPTLPTAMDVPETIELEELREVRPVDQVFQHQRDEPIEDAGQGGFEEEPYSCWPAVACLIMVSLVELILFSYDAQVERNKSGTGPVATRLIYNPYKRYEAWRFISYMFVHIGSAHLTINLFVQILLGIPLGMEHSWWRVLLVYLAGVASGSLGTSVIDPGVFLAGASGGVYALIAAQLPTLFMYWSKMKYALVQFVIFLLLIIMDIGIVKDNEYDSDLDQNIGHESHYAGAIAGLLVGISVLRDLKVKKWKKKLWQCAIVTYVVLMITAVFINIFWTDHFPAS